MLWYYFPLEHYYGCLFFKGFRGYIFLRISYEISLEGDFSTTVLIHYGNILKAYGKKFLS